MQARRLICAAVVTLLLLMCIPIWAANPPGQEPTKVVTIGQTVQIQSVKARLTGLRCLHSLSEKNSTQAKAAGVGHPPAAQGWR